MCRMASFLYKNSEENGVEIAVYKLDSHSDTQKHLKLSEKMGWFEGHYLPNGKIECRKPNGIDKDAMDEIKRRYKNFNTFLKWAFKQNSDFSGWLDLSDCDLKRVKLPDKIGGNLYLSGCDLKGVKLPDKIGGYLNLSGCDLKGIKLPASIGGALDLRGCDLKGVKLPDSIGGALDLRDCDLKGIKLPDSIGGSLYLSGCDLKGIKLPASIGGGLYLRGCINIDKDLVSEIKIGGEIYW